MRVLEDLTLWTAEVKEEDAADAREESQRRTKLNEKRRNRDEDAKINICTEVMELMLKI